VPCPFAIIGGPLPKARTPDGLEARVALIPGGAKAGGGGFLAHSAALQVMRELEGTVAARLRAGHLLGEARIRKPASGSEIVEHRLEVFALLHVRDELAGELGAGMLPSREKRKGA